MIPAPLIVHFLEKYGFSYLARFMALIGYSWMGIVLLLFSILFVFDLYRLIIYLGELSLKNNFSYLVLSYKGFFITALFLTMCTATYAYFEAKNIHTTKLVIKTSKIPKEIGILKIAQISDIHLGLIVREKRLKTILKAIKKENPHILVSTGDLVDGEINDLKNIVALLKEINPRYGKFAVTGNHEFYAGLSQALYFTEEAGFKILRGEIVNIAGFINIVGIDDPAAKTYGISKDVSEKELLSTLSPKKFTLLLKHRPIVDEKALGLFDLQLSGHTHKGQLFPFSLITKFYYPIDAGCLKLSDSSYLYVNRGAGTWGPPMRFLSPPELTIIEIIHKE
jgi:hypothetical protein